MNKLLAILAFFAVSCISTAHAFSFSGKKPSVHKKAQKKANEDYSLNLVARDARTGMLLNATFSVTPKAGGPALKINTDNSQNLIVVKTGIVYKITAKSEGYQFVEREVSFTKDPDQMEARNYNIDMKPQFGAIAIIQAVDKNSGERVEVTFEVIGRTSGKKYVGKLSMMEQEHRLNVYGDEIFDIVINADLYKPFKQELPIELSESLKSLNFTAQLEKSEPALNIKVVDAASRQPVKNANIEITNMTDAKLVLSKKGLENGEVYTTVIPERQYNIAVDAEGYEPALRTLENILFKKNITISLRKKAVEAKEEPRQIVKSNYLIRVVDAASKAGVSGSNIRLTDANNQNITVRKSDMEWFAELEDGGKYTISVQAPNYEAYQKPLVLTLSRMIEVGISPAPTQNISILVVDATTRQPLIAKVNIVGGKTQINSSTDGQKAYQITLPQQQNYQIEISATGYNNSKRVLEIPQALSSEQARQVFELRKEIVTANYKIAVVDAEQKSPIEEAEVRLTDSKNQAIKAVRNGNNWTAELNEDDSYQVEVSAAGYDGNKSILTKNANKTAEIALKKKVVVVPTQDVFVTVLDAITQNPVPATLRLTDSQANTISNTQDNNRAKFSLRQQQSYRLEISATGYKPYQESINLSTPLTDANKVIRLQKDISNYNFSLRAIDAQSRQEISGAKITVINTKTNQSVSIKNVGGEQLVELNSDADYKIEAEASTYQNRNAEIRLSDGNVPNLKQDIFLSKKAPERYRIVVSDTDTQKPIEADLVLLNAANQNVQVVKNGTEWFVDLGQDEQTYILDAKALDYENKRVSVQAGNEKLIAVGLKKMPPPAMQSLAFVAVDGITRKPIAASFKLTDAQFNNLTGTTTAESSQYNTTLKPQMTYQVEVQSANYKPYQGTLVTNSKADENIKEIQLKRELYTFTFTASDIQTDERLKNVKFLVNDLTKKMPASARINANTGEYLVDLNPESDYSVEINADGYVKMTDRINPMQLLIRQETKRNFALGSKAEHYKIVLIDAERKSRIPQADVKVIDSSDQEILVSQNTQVSEWGVDLILAENYTIIVKANGFDPYKAKLEKDADKRVEISVRRIPTQDLFFGAVDEFSKKAIGATYRIVAGEETFNGNTIPADNARFKTSLKKGTAYTVEVQSLGYRPYRETLNISQDLIDANKIVSLRKETYSFNYKAVDAQSKQVVTSAKLQFYNLTVKRPVAAQNLSNGEYQVNFNPDDDYFVDIEANGYEKIFSKVDVERLASRQEFNQAIVLNALKKDEAKPLVKEDIKKVEEFKDLKVGKVIRLDNVYFDQSSYILRPESYEQLDRLAQSLKNTPALKIEIGGHTDNVGDSRLNLILSENRAKVIASYLFNKGIKDDRILHKGYGQSQPVAANDTEDNKRKNRRVELIVKEN